MMDEPDRTEGMAGEQGGVLAPPVETSARPAGIWLSASSTSAGSELGPSTSYPLPRPPPPLLPSYAPYLSTSSVLLGLPAGSATSASSRASQWSTGGRSAERAAGFMPPRRNQAASPSAEKWRQGERERNWNDPVRMRAAMGVQEATSLMSSAPVREIFLPTLYRSAETSETGHP
eukprot:294226-Hanusia_phi.AAC.2